MADARLPDNNLLMGLRGYGVPIKDKKAKADSGKSLAEGFLTNLRIVSEADYINRYKWYGLEDIGLDQELLERMLYYRYQVGLFFDENKFYCLPYVLNGSIDLYGRYTGVSFLPFNGKATEKDVYIPGEGRIPQYDVILPEELTVDALQNSCVLLNDYTRQISQTGIPHAQLQDHFMKMEAEIYPMARTALLSQCGIRALNIANANQSDTVDILNQQIYDASQDGKIFLGFNGNATTVQLGAVPAAQPEEYLMYLQSLDNQRLAAIGLENGGIFQKKAHELQSENNLIVSNAQKVYYDGLANRQKWCLIARSIWPWLRLWCTADETEVEQDLNGDGELGNVDNNPDNEVEENGNNME